MGFLRSLSGILGAGNQSESQVNSQSGFALLPGEIQNAFKDYGNAVNAQIPNAQTAYRPLAQTADETRAFDTIRRGFTPTQESLSSDISMLMNPFNDSVINRLNREAQGQFSILKQNADQAGQFGSNRQMLGANDIENSRQANIGSLLQSQYNQAISQIFNNLIPQRQQDAQGLLNIGNFERGLDTQTNASAITGLQELGKALGVLPASGGSNQQQTSSSFGSSVPGGILGSIAGGVGGLAGGLGGGAIAGTSGGALSGLLGALALSDKRLKQNIKHVGKENGHNIYEFSYIGSSHRFTGVMAQEVEKKFPDAIKIIGGYKAVDYNKIGVQFRSAA